MKNSMEVKINGYNCGSFDGSGALGFIFGTFIEDLSFMSDDAIKDLLSGMFDLMADFPSGALLSRKIRRGNDLLKDYDRFDVIRFMVDQYLASEKMGLLSGFGVAICENVEGRHKIIRRLLVNPEKQFISDLM